MPDHSHWYYILGWFIGVTLHNWPVMIAMVASAYAALKLYWRPTRRNVQWLYGWALLVFAYEYIKHLGAYLADPVRFLFTTDWAWMQPAGRILIEIVAPSIMIVVALLFLLKAMEVPRVRLKISFSTAANETPANQNFEPSSGAPHSTTGTRQR